MRPFKALQAMLATPLPSHTCSTVATPDWTSHTRALSSVSTWALSSAWSALPSVHPLSPPFSQQPSAPPSSFLLPARPWPSLCSHSTLLPIWAHGPVPLVPVCLFALSLGCELPQVLHSVPGPWSAPLKCVQEGLEGKREREGAPSEAQNSSPNHLHLSP